MPFPVTAAHAAFLAPVTRHTRRVDIYEQDATTPWLLGAKFTEGTVTVDYGRAERRAVDITLDNDDGSVRYAPDNFWYDKVLKVYRGVEYFEDSISKVDTALNYVPNPSFEVGLTGYNLTACTAAQSASWAASGTNSMRLTPSGSSTDSYANIGGDSGAIRLSLALNKTYTIKATGFAATNRVGSEHATRARRIVVFVRAPSLNGNVVVEYTSAIVPVNSTNGKRVSVTFNVPNDATEVYFRLYNGSNNAADLVYWDAVQITQDGTVPYFDGSLSNGRWTGTAHNSQSYLQLEVHNKTLSNWETQIGEFMIDSLKEINFPDTVSVTGRDYAKKMLSSKFSVATGFTSTDSLDSVIGSLAANAGIVASKRLIPITGKTLGRSFVFERGVNRWDACKQLAEAHGYELFFDAQGMLVMRQFLDPSTSPLAYTFETGEFGSLVTYDKTVSDSRLFNHVVVAGEATDTVPVWAEAKNENPSSPTSIQEIGTRYTEYISSFITTTPQAQALADQLLAIYSLQEYDLNFSSLMLPWMEVGEIIEFIDPKATITQPDRFLLSQLNIPLGLGPMTGTGKRVTIIG